MAAECLANVRGQSYDISLIPATDIHPGKSIKARREALGLRREDVAYEAGLSIDTVGRIERGAVFPRRATLAVIEGVLAPRESEAA